MWIMKPNQNYFLTLIISLIELATTYNQSDHNIYKTYKKPLRRNDKKFTILTISLFFYLRFFDILFLFISFRLSLVLMGFSCIVGSMAVVPRIPHVG